jgi:hypothetical protein
VLAQPKAVDGFLISQTAMFMFPSTTTGTSIVSADFRARMGSHEAQRYRSQPVEHKGAKGILRLPGCYH